MEEAKDNIQNQSEEDQKYNEDEEGNDSDPNTEQSEIEGDDLTLEWQNNIKNAENTYIRSAKSFLEWALTQSKIKVIQEQMTWDPTITICDISLNNRGYLNDKKQQYLPIYLINIQRGNSICIIKNKKEDEIFFCRRGMRKFYDLLPEYFNENEELSGHHQKIKFLTLGDAQEKLESGQYRVHLYKQFKESGEHCQISYFIDKWLISTKQATILVNNREEIEKNYDNRLIYYQAKLISNEWFNILDKMKKKDIENLKKKMQNLTFIGDYCGNQKHWPIILYKKPEIIFYSVVENNSPNICLHVEEAFQIFNLFSLQTARMTEIKNIETFQELKDKLNQELKKVATGRIEDEGQGEVVYIIAEDKNNSEQKILSCCKLKNIEYKIYSKLREFLLFCIEKKMKSRLRYERFKWEIEKIIEYNQPPKSLDHYLLLAKNSFAYIDKNINNLSQDILKYQFIPYIEIINKQCRLILLTLPGLVSDQTIDRLAKSLQIDQVETKWLEEQKIINQHLNLLYIPPKISEKIKDQNLHFAMIGFDQQGQEKSLNMLEDEIKKLQQSKFSANMALFINCKNKFKMIESTSQRVQQFENQLKQQYPTKYSIYPSSLTQDELIKQLELTFSNMFSDSNEEIPEQQTIVQNNGKNIKGEKKSVGKEKIKVTVILPMALPGSGKSYFCKLLETIIKEEYPNCSFYSVSSDQIRQKLIQEYQKDPAYSKLTSQQLYIAAAKQNKEEYLIQQKQLLTKISTESKQALIFLDRLYTFEILEEAITFLKGNCPPNVDIKVSAFVVKSSSEFNIKNNSYYLSEQIFLNCLNRTFNRIEHETLQEDQVLTTKIVLRYFQMFINLKIQTMKSQKYINLLGEIPLINEQMSQIDQSLIQKFGKCLDLIPPGDYAPNSKIYQDFVQSFNVANFQFQYPDAEILKTAAKNYINDCLNIN